VAQLERQLNGRLQETLTLDDQPLTIGRDPDNRLSLGGPRIAAHHAEIIASPEGPVLIDLASPAGTQLNGAPVQANQPYLLSDGAAISIGVHTLIYRAAVPTAQDEAARGGRAPQDSPTELLDQASLAALFSPPPAPRQPQPQPRAPSGAGRYLYDLPAVYHEQELLGRYLQIFEQIWEPMEQRHDHIALYFDPRTAPGRFVDWLASWFDLHLSPELAEQYRRRVAADAFRLQRWQATPAGLENLIALSTGFIVQVSDLPEQPFVFEVRVWMPRDRTAEQPIVEALIQANKPVFAGYVLQFELIDPPAEHTTESTP
jgi:phage tail-like protein